MVLILIIVIPFTLFATWLFFKKSPADERKKSVHIFNLIIIILALISCSLLSMNVYARMAGGSDRAWWPIISLLGSLFLFPAWLLTGSIVRLIVFKKKK